jgi:hypothetical protein
VNGVSESVTVGAAFPSATQLFVLRTLTAKIATIGIVGGSYASGAPAITLKVNQPVTLQNTADGTKFTLVLLPQGTVTPVTPVTPAAPAAPATPGG